MISISRVRKLGAYGAVIAAILLIQSAGRAPISVCAKTGSFDSPLVSPETKRRLMQIEQERRELHEQAVRARRKEKDALVRLNKIETKLNVTKGVLNEHQHELKKTE